MSKFALAFLSVASYVCLVGCTEHDVYKGTVINELNEPVSAAIVTLQHNGSVVATSKTNAKGAFSIAHDEPTGGCGALDNDYSLVVRSDATTTSAYVEIDGRHFATLPPVRLLGTAPTVELSRDLLDVTSTSGAVMIDDGLQWDVAGVAEGVAGNTAVPVEALTAATSGMHLVRRLETLDITVQTSTAAEVTATPPTTRLAIDGDANLSDNRYAAVQGFDEPGLTLNLTTPASVKTLIVANVRSASLSADPTTWTATVTATLADNSTITLTSASCQQHSTSLWCEGGFGTSAVQSIHVEYAQADATTAYFHVGEALVYGVAAQ